MATAHSRGTGLWVDKYNLQQRTQEFAFAISTDMASIGGLSANEQVYLPGQRTVTLTQAGIWDDDASIGPDAVFAALASTQANGVIFVPGSTTAGATAYILDAQLLTNRTYPSGPGDAVKFSATWQGKEATDTPNPPVWRGKLLGATTVSSSPSNGAAHNFGADGSAGVAAFLSVTAFTGTSAVFKVQSSNDGSTGWADEATFTTTTGTTSEVTFSSGAVDQYLRWYVSGTFTSITFAIAAAIYGVNF